MSLRGGDAVQPDRCNPCGSRKSIRKPNDQNASMSPKFRIRASWGYKTCIQNAVPNENVDSRCAMHARVLQNAISKGCRQKVCRSWSTFIHSLHGFSVHTRCPAQRSSNVTAIVLSPPFTRIPAEDAPCPRPLGWAYRVQAGRS